MFCEVMPSIRGFFKALLNDSDEGAGAFSLHTQGVGGFLRRYERRSDVLGRPHETKYRAAAAGCSSREAVGNAIR